MIKLLASFACLAAAAAAGTVPAKISGSGRCGAVEARQTVEAGDVASHSLTVVKSSCTFTTPIEMAGLKAKTYTVAAAYDRSGDSSQDRAYLVLSMDNGDKAFVTLQGTAEYKSGRLTSRRGSWTYTGGTGKLTGLQGKGAYHATPAGDTIIEGDYSLPAAQ